MAHDSETLIKQMNDRVGLEHGGKNFLAALIRQASDALAAETARADREATARRQAERIATALVGFQARCQRNVVDSAPGNEHYAGMLLAIVDDARALLGMSPRPSVRETMDERAQLATREDLSDRINDMLRGNAAAMDLEPGEVELLWEVADALRATREQG